jgi:hypothetical protein
MAKDEIRDLDQFSQALRESWPREFEMNSSDKSDLTPSELETINSKHRCPDCRKGELLEGPWGGSTFNGKCNNAVCGHEFWLAISPSNPGVVWSGGRLDRDAPGLYRDPFPWPKSTGGKIMKIVKALIVLTVLAAIGLVAYLYTIP